MEEKKLRKVVWEEEGFWIDSGISIGQEGKPEDLFYEGKTLEQAMHGNFTKAKVWTHKYREDGHAVFDNELEALENAYVWAEHESEEECRILGNRIKELKGKA